MNNEQEKSRIYEIVAQSIQKRMIYISRQNVTLNHDTWELEYEPVYEENPQDDYSSNDSAYENNHYKTLDQEKISSILTFLVVCLIIYFLGKPFYEVYQQDKIYFEKHNAIHSQIVKKIKNYGRPIDDFKKIEVLYAEENKLRPRLGKLEKCEQCSYLKHYVEALLYFDKYKQDGKIKHIDSANYAMDKIPLSYSGDCADQIKYSRDYFLKIHRTGGMQTATKQNNNLFSFVWKMIKYVLLAVFIVFVIILNLGWYVTLEEFISLLLEIFRVVERKKGRSYFEDFFDAVMGLIWFSIFVVVLNLIVIMSVF